jgi:hypothetical protein
MTSLIIWLLAAIRQYKGSLFYFFILLALEDPVGFLYNYFYRQTNIFIHAVFTELIFFSLFKLKRKSIYLILPIALVIILIHFMIARVYIEEIIHIFFCVLLFIRLLQLFSIKLISEREFSLSLWVLTLYVITLIAKSLSLLINVRNGVFYFNITSIFELLVGIFFVIFKTEDPRLVFKLK